MKRFIKFLLSKVGYEIRKKNNLPIASPQHCREGSGLNIELIGSSGIGKSTLIKNLSERGAISSWLLFNPVRNILCAHEKKSMMSQELRALYLKLWRDKVDSIYQNDFISSKQKIALGAFYLKNLRADMGLRTLYLSNGVINDDSVLHNFRSEILSNTSVFPEEIWKQFLQRRALIYLYSNYESVRENLLKRKETQALRFNWLNELGEERYFEFFKRSTEQYKAISRFAREKGMKVLHLNINKTDKEEQIKRILNLIADLKAQNIVQKVPD